MMPRFIVSVRELYDRDARRRWQAIDTGFGVWSQPTSSQSTAASAITFADVTSRKAQGHIAEVGADGLRAMRSEAFGDHTYPV